MFLGVSLPVLAQSAAPGHTLADNIAALSVRAEQVLPTLQYELVSQLIEWIEWISVSLGVVITLYSFARLWRETGGGGIDALWWCIRLGICLFLVGSGPSLVQQL